MIDRLNDAIHQQQVGDKTTTPMTALPEWGVVVKAQDGSVVDVFGQVPYDVTPAGQVEVPGYQPPPNATLEVVPQKTWAELASAEDLDDNFRPLSSLPGAVGTASDFLANEFCGKRNRPTSISLNLVAGVSGTIYFATANTEIGSNVEWEFREDLCPRYGLEGEGIPFKG